MDELLGFVVLSALPLALLAILVLGCVAVWLAIRGTKTRWKKGLAALLAASIVVLIPTWDVIAGRIHFNRLCATESGIRVYKKVRLDPVLREVQLPDSVPKYEHMPIAKRYPYGYESSEKIPGPATIKFSREFIRDARTGEVLGTVTTFF